MICTLLNRELGFLCRRLLRFLNRSIFRAMGCFSVCFRVKDGDRASRRPAIRSTKPSDVVISRNRLSSLFLAEEREDTHHSDRERCPSGSPQVHKQLRDEAKFLKACGTLPETPEEIRNNSAKLRSSTPNDKTSTSQFRSWLPNASPKKLGMDKQPERTHAPTKLREVMANDYSPEHTPNSCITNTQDTGSASINSTKYSGDESSHVANKVHIRQVENATSPTTPYAPAPSTQYRNKSVQFDCGDDVHSFRGHGNEDYKESQSLENQSSKRSINPTPLKLSDDMQTPGTVFPGNLGTLPNRVARVRSEYVYSIPGDGSHVHSLEKTNDDERNSGRGFGKASEEKEVKVEVGLSEWLKPPVPRHEPRIGKAPGERPIIGLVATHWNENQLIEVSPPKKGWDGNGIPNSTNKYKEDQKVSWHATPFEERLEKALSEETFSQRNQDKGMAIGFNEEDEDTAASKLHISGHSESMVSV